MQKIDWNISFNDEQSNLIRLDFIPQVMEDKWFSYFKNNVLYQFRSWTGICIDEIYFESYPKGLRAVYAKVNRDPERYTEVDDREDAHRIKSLLSDLAGLENEVATDDEILVSKPSVKDNNFDALLADLKQMDRR